MLKTRLCARIEFDGQFLGYVTQSGSDHHVFGGHVNTGEHWEDALKREVFEETGLVGNAGGLVDTQVRQDGIDLVFRFFVRSKIAHPVEVVSSRSQTPPVMLTPHYKYNVQAVWLPLAVIRAAGKNITVVPISVWLPSTHG